MLEKKHCESRQILGLGMHKSGRPDQRFQRGRASADYWIGFEELLLAKLSDCALCIRPRGSLYENRAHRDFKRTIGRPPVLRPVRGRELSKQRV